MKLKNLENFFAEYSNFNTKSADAKKITDVISHLEKSFLAKKMPALRNRANIISAFNLVLDLSTRGNILGKEKLIGTFFNTFIRNLQKEFEKQPADRDPEMLSYQSAVTQGADKIKSVRIRHDILLKKIAGENRFFYDLVNPQTPEEKFKSLYERVRIVFKLKNSSEVEQWLLKNNGLKFIKCSGTRKEETYIGHIRDCIHHPAHGDFTPRNLMKGIKALEKIISSGQ